MRFARGQPVTWPPAPNGLAQVVELRRTRVRLYYRCRTGRERQPVVPAAALAGLQRGGVGGLQPPLPLHNPYGRAAMGGPPREYEEPEAKREEARCPGT
jgi:hypothetical protein